MSDIIIFKLMLTKDEAQMRRNNMDMKLVVKLKLMVLKLSSMINSSWYVSSIWNHQYRVTKNE